MRGLQGTQASWGSTSAPVPTDTVPFSCDSLGIVAKFRRRHAAGAMFSPPPEGVIRTSFDMAGLLLLTVMHPCQKCIAGDASGRGAEAGAEILRYQGKDNTGKKVTQSKGEMLIGRDWAPPQHIVPVQATFAMRLTSCASVSQPLVFLCLCSLRMRTGIVSRDGMRQRAFHRDIFIGSQRCLCWQ